MKKNQEDKTSIALINNNISFIQSDVKEIKQSIKELSGVFVTKSEHLEILKVQEDHEHRTRAIEQNMWKYVGIYSAVSFIVATVTPFILRLF